MIEGVGGSIVVEDRGWDSRGDRGWGEIWLAW